MDHEEIKIHDLYPELSDDELKRAEENLKKYLKIVMRIHDRLTEEERLKIVIRLEWEKRFKGRNSAS